jgi:SAM-dependent methyltransferase
MNITEELNQILVALWRKGVKRPGPAHQLLVEETKHVSPEVAEMEKGSPKSIAFLLYHWPLFYQEGLSLLGEVPESLGKILTIGSPFAPYGVAAAVLGAREVTFVDANPDSLRIGSEIAGKLGVSLQGRKVIPNELFDTIVLDRVSLDPEALAKYNSLLKPEGCLVIIDSAEPITNRAFVTMRDEMVDRGFAVQAPCVWKGPCPARVFGFPCFAQRPMERTFVMREIQKRAGIEQNSLKMSYLILRKKGREWPNLPVAPTYRVVSHPLEGPSGKRFTLCGTDGKKRLNLTQETFPKEARALSFLKRGELIYLEDELRKGDDIFAGTGTKAKILAALGKPIPEKENET